MISVLYISIRLKYIIFVSKKRILKDFCLKLLHKTHSHFFSKTIFFSLHGFIEVYTVVVKNADCCLLLQLHQCLFPSKILLPLHFSPRQKQDLTNMISIRFSSDTHLSLFHIVMTFFHTVIFNQPHRDNHTFSYSKLAILSHPKLQRYTFKNTHLSYSTTMIYCHC